MKSPVHRTERRAGRGTKLTLVAFALTCLLAVLAARHFLYSSGDESNFDATPLPVPEQDAPFITTPDLVVDKMVELARLSAGDLVYDLGCGDGRIVIAAALASGCRGVGYDIDPQRVEQATDNVLQSGMQDRVTIVEQDIFQVDLSQADAAVMYLLPWMMNKLRPQFERMKPGARIVTHAFWIDGIEPDQYVELQIGENRKAFGIYVYETPLKKNSTLEKGKPPRPSQAALRLEDQLRIGIDFENGRHQPIETSIRAGTLSSQLLVRRVVTPCGEAGHRLRFVANSNLN